MMRMGRKKKFQLRRPKRKNKTPTADDASSSAAAPPWTELPTDVTANILGRLGSAELLESAQKVCTTWWKVCQDPAMWRVVDMKLDDDEAQSSPYYAMMCRRAVNRSKGQLIDITIDYFGTDELMDFISGRSSSLRRLRIACCKAISGQGFREAVKRFPQLEELHLFFMPLIGAEDIETIGISCPMLKSFTFNDRGYRFPLIEFDDGYALAVAKTMPNLCHLSLFGNKLKNEGLEAILDSCPHLKSLDLRQCFSVDLRWDFGKRCAQQIKDLRRPSDSTDDYEWDAEIYDCEDDDYAYAYDYDEYSDITIGDYDDFTDPFHSDYIDDNHLWFFDHEYF